MTIKRLGATGKYAAGWEAAFGGKKRAAKSTAKAGAAKTAMAPKKAAQCRKAATGKSK